YFFFSSRRRHTRSKRDWSSDVCSSDLRTGLPSEYLRAERYIGTEEVEGTLLTRTDFEGLLSSGDALELREPPPARANCVLLVLRSEERRVGKGGRAGWWRGH